MSVQVAKTNLLDAVKVLNERWERAKQVWEDQAARDFQTQVIEQIEPKVRAAIKGFDQVGELILLVRRECGDDYLS
ncbi:MAG TPA: hypothetical protein VK176_09295 [Phycisphaerales bacterium]|nr:hypothetical protein [Phycisphaerales bacterium]